MKVDFKSTIEQYFYNHILTMLLYSNNNSVYIYLKLLKYNLLNIDFLYFKTWIKRFFAYTIMPYRYLNNYYKVKSIWQLILKSKISLCLKRTFWLPSKYFSVTTLFKTVSNCFRNHHTKSDRTILTSLNKRSKLYVTDGPIHHKKASLCWWSLTK